LSKMGTSKRTLTQGHGLGGTKRGVVEPREGEISRGQMSPYTLGYGWRRRMTNLLTSLLGKCLPIKKAAPNHIKGEEKIQGKEVGRKKLNEK